MQQLIKRPDEFYVGLRNIWIRIDTKASVEYTGASFVTKYFFLREKIIS